MFGESTLHDDQTLITAVGGATITVCEAFDMVAEMVNPDRQAGC